MICNLNKNYVYNTICFVNKTPDSSSPFLKHFQTAKEGIKLTNLKADKYTFRIINTGARQGGSSRPCLRTQEP
jgi:hypothetical protein